MFLHMLNPFSMQESLSASVDYDSACDSSSITPVKRFASDSVDYMENMQLSSTKLMRDIKKYKWNCIFLLDPL